MSVLPTDIRNAIGDKIENGFISLMYVDEVKGIDHRVDQRQGKEHEEAQEKGNEEGEAQQLALGGVAYFHWESPPIVQSWAGTVPASVSYGSSV